MISVGLTLIEEFVHLLLELDRFIYYTEIVLFSEVKPNSKCLIRE